MTEESGRDPKIPGSPKLKTVIVMRLFLAYCARSLDRMSAMTLRLSCLTMASSTLFDAFEPMNVVWSVAESGIRRRVSQATPQSPETMVL